MRVLVIGSGAREHALVWKLRFCPDVTMVYAAPGNAGISFLAKTAPIPATDIAGLIQLARDERIDLTIVGPEAPLAEGIVDAFERFGLRIFGPSKQAAQIEASKVWAKDLMDRHGIPTARWAMATSPDQARTQAREFGAPVVLKADGLAGGKGAVVCQTLDEADQVVREFMEQSTLGEAGQRLVVEEFLVGEELSVFALADGESVLPLIGARDFKRLEDGDQGPNTGGMGGYAPSGYASRELMEEVRASILEPTVRAMAEEGVPYKGVLYAGLMLTAAGPKVLEYNCRWGDPEAELVLPLLKTDMLELMNAVVDGTLAQKSVEWHEGATCGVVLASGGYPVAPQTAVKISGLDEVEDGVLVFHGATRVLTTPEPRRGWLRRGVRRTTEDDIGFFTDGGRVLTVVARGATLTEARARAYANIEKIQFDGMQYRRDIGANDPTAQFGAPVQPPIAQGAPATLVDLRPEPVLAALEGGDQPPLAMSAAAPSTGDSGWGPSPAPAPAQTGGSEARPLVAVLMGSESDRPIMDETSKILDNLGIAHEVHVMSAHRTPERVRDFSRSAIGRGLEVIIAGAGGAAHLPGVIAAQTTLPVIGVPIPGSSMMGLDSLLSIVQMPGGVPVATVATGNAGARNAAYLAAGILSLGHADIRAKYRQFRIDQSGGELA